MNVGTNVLFRFQRPIGTTKLFEEWKGLYRVKKILDSDSYLISSEDDPRKEYVAFRPRLKVFGNPVRARSGMAKDESSLEKREEREVKKCAHDPIVQKPAQLITQPLVKSEKGHGHNLRGDRTTDYRKFFA